MKIQEIVVSAGRVVNHPFENYSNLRPSVTLKATLNEGEDWQEATKELQAKAEQLVEDHKNHMLESLEKLHNLSVAQREVASLEEAIRSHQSRLNSIRKRIPQLGLKERGAEESEQPDDFEEQPGDEE